MLLFSLLVTSTGCSPWAATSAGNSLLKPPRMSADSVVLEFALVEIPHNENEEYERLWGKVDEQHLPTDLRRKLAANGLRCGVIGAQLPNWVRGQLDSPRKSVELISDDGMASICESTTQGRVHCRPGQQRAITVTDKRKELNIDEESEDQMLPVTYEEATCEFALVAEPQGDGRVRLELTPEISHGPPRQRWVGNDGLFRVDLTRDRKRFMDSQLVATLSPGQTLLVAAAPDAQNLGKAFFLEDAKSRRCRKILLVRLAQTQCDDLFAPERSLTPIATQGE
jgi:hypothetical protein